MTDYDIDKVSPRPWKRVVKHGDVSVIDANGDYIVRAKDFSTQFSSSEAYYHFIECTLMHEELVGALEQIRDNTIVSARHHNMQSYESLMSEIQVIVEMILTKAKGESGD